MWEESPRRQIPADGPGGSTGLSTRTYVDHAPGQIGGALHEVSFNSYLRLLTHRFRLMVREVKVLPRLVWSHAQLVPGPVFTPAPPGGRPDGLDGQRTRVGHLRLRRQPLHQVLGDVVVAADADTGRQMLGREFVGIIV